MREKTIEAKLVKAVRIMGGLAPKFISPGFDGVPDRLVLLPMDTSAWPDGVYRQDCYDLLLGFWQLTDVLLWLALTAALIATAALLRGRKTARPAN